MFVLCLPHFCFLQFEIQIFRRWVQIMMIFPFLTSQLISVHYEMLSVWSHINNLLYLLHEVIQSEFMSKYIKLWKKSHRSSVGKILLRGAWAEHFLTQKIQKQQPHTHNAVQSLIYFCKLSVCDLLQAYTTSESFKK